MEAGRSARRMIVAITGASGIRRLGARSAAGDEDREPLIVSKAGDQTRAFETDYSAADLRALADIVYAPGDVAAAISSGSFQTMGMIVAPCWVRTLSDIAHGVTSTLVARPASSSCASELMPSIW
jgi:flavin prenyltransferase